jgi:hypothetical protein
MIGDGTIDLASLASASHHGDVEIEILNERFWREAKLDTLLNTAGSRSEAYRRVLY